MSITVEFKDFEEMVAFAKQLISVPEQSKVKQDTTIMEKKNVVPGETKTEEGENPNEISLTIEDIREVFVEKNSTKGNTAKLKAILKEFKVSKVTDLEEKDFDAVMARLKEI